MDDRTSDNEPKKPEEALTPMPDPLPPGMAQRKFVSTAELAKALDVDPRTLIKAAKDGKVPALRIAREFRFDPAAVRLALSNNAKRKKQG
jgi:hypothetical protein